MVFFEKLAAKSLKNIDIAFAIVLIPLYLLMFGMGEKSYFKQWDENILDYLQGFTEYKTHAKNISIVAVDTKSIDKIGRWPWSRDKMAELIRVLNGYYNAKVIAFDITFSEKDKNFELLTSGMNSFQESFIRDSSIDSQTKLVVEDSMLGVLKNKNTDQIFADEIKKWDNIVLGYLFIQNISDLQHLSGIERELQSIPESSVVVVKQDDKWHRAFQTADYIETNIPLFVEDEKTQVGYFTILPDPDGVVRRHHLLWLYSGNKTLYPSLDLQVLRILSRDDEGHLPQVRVHTNEQGVNELTVGDQEINVNDDGGIYINYKGKSGHFPTYSFYDVLNKTIPKEKLRNHIIYVGVTEIGIYDIRSTPIENTFPGVEIHANVIDNLISGQSYSANFVNMALTIMMLAFFVITLLVLNRKISFLKSKLTIFFLLLVYIAGNVYLVFNHYTWLAFSPIIFFVVVESAFHIFAKYYLEQKEKHFIKDTFKKYLSPELIEDIIKNPSLLKLGGEKRILTIFFSDIKGFTGIAEKMESAEMIVLLNEYFDSMSNTILDHQGTVGKYIGDGILAFFGAPILRPDHALDCCRAAFEMQKKLVVLRKKWMAEGKPEIFVRIGINTGPIIVGNMGSSLRMEYTVMGDPVNAASRLEAANKIYGTDIMISEHTYAEVKDRVSVRELDVIRVVGKQDPIRIYEPVGLTEDVSDDVHRDIDTFHDGLAFFRKRQWNRAIEQFNVALAGKNDTLLKLYTDRCEIFKVNPPPENWNGVFVMVNK